MFGARVKVVWECPTCRYGLEGLVEEDRARCPECGVVWTKRQLAEVQGFFTWPDWRWAWAAGLTPVVMVAGMAAGWRMTGLAGGLVWAWVCVWVMMAQMMRPRLGDMASVFGAMTAVPVAGVWGGVWWSVSGLVWVVLRGMSGDV
ncbi:MAG TPA: hypothetical protein VD997_15195 [Phycisphaerales bacterium]|nr:hypothetical protein [Phycisphaerales bacterium]